MANPFDQMFPDQARMREAAKAEREKLGLTVEGVAWLVKKLKEHAKEGGTYRYLIYTRLGFPDESDAYCRLLEAGLMELHNEMAEKNREEEI